MNGEARPRRQSRIGLKVTRPFAVYCAVLLGFWYAGISQSNAVAYLLLFLLVSLGAVSLPIGYRNLRHVGAKLKGEPAGFADEALKICAILENHGPGPAWGIQLVLKSLPATQIMAAEADALPVKAQLVVEVGGHLPRGAHILKEIHLRSEFPLGLFRWEKRVPSDASVIVYPARRGTLPLPPPDPEGTEKGKVPRQTMGDDFRGWRKSLPGDSSRHIDWKAVARGQPMMVKQFETTAGQSVKLSFQALRLPDIEDRLAQLARWIWDCRLRKISYALELPDLSLPAAATMEHERMALRALATFTPTKKGNGRS